jgi:hypothetical protein
MSRNNLGMDNAYFRSGCPPVMSDGRFMTYYNSTNELTNKLQKASGYASSNSFRTHLQNNAENIMAAETKRIKNEYGCNPTISCSQGFFDLHTIHGGDLSKFNCRQ